MVSNQSIDTVFKQQLTENNSSFESYLNLIDEIFDITQRINEPSGQEQIIDYYVHGKNSFLLLVSLEGFYHYGISYDGRYKKEDFREQARIAERYIRENDAKNVLELAYGMGANMAFLARRNPSVMFDGVDLALKPLKRFTKISNINFQSGDYMT